MASRIIFFSKGRPWWGIQSGPTLLRHLLKFQADGHEIVCCYTDHGTPPDADYPFQAFPIPRRRPGWPPHRASIPGSETFRAHLITEHLVKELKVTREDTLITCPVIRETALIAAVVAEKTGARLHVIMHDLWERREDDGVFQRLLRQAETVISVSYGLCGYIRPFTKREVPRIFPIGNAAIEGASCGPPQNGELTVGIGGSMSPDYVEWSRKFGDQVLALGAKEEETGGDPNITCVPRFPKNEDALRYLRENCHALLIYQTFEPEAYIHYSFPGRLIDFSQTGVPLIVCSRPFSSVGHWAREENWKLWLNDPSDTDQIARIRERLLDPTGWQEEADRTRALAEGPFNADHIHRQIYKLVFNNS